MSAMSRQTGSATRVRVGGPFRLSKAFDEMNGTGGGVRAPYRPSPSGSAPEARRPEAQARRGRRRCSAAPASPSPSTATTEATERLIPFDIIPRIISAAEWRRLTAGIEQRVRALNAFMYDIYHRQEIIKAGQGSRGAGHPELGLRAGDDRRRAAARHLLATSSASTSCAPARTSSSCSRTTRARPRASPTCWRTAKR